MSEPLRIIIPPAQAKQRLDKALSAGCALSRSYVQQLIADGHVQCDGKIVTSPTVKVAQGQCYEICVPQVAPLALEPVPMALDIVFEDAQLLVINKPAGLTVHPAAGTKEPTLVHGLLAHCGDTLSGIGGVARPGIVHRLDKDTSGLMLVAKTDLAHQHLSAQLKDRSLSRGYEALCWGAPLPLCGRIEGDIGRHPKDRICMAVVAKGGKHACTHYEVLAGYGAISHVACKLETGRTHQIRVHFNHIGHGLLGDPVYGQPTEKRLKHVALGEALAQVVRAFERQALHAAHIAFIHPTSQQPMQFSCPLPADMQALLAALRG